MTSTLPRCRPLPALLLALAWAAPAGAAGPAIHPELAAHTDHFAKKVYAIPGGVYSAVGWNLANTILVEGDDGVIIVDVGESTDASRQVAAEFAKITTKPVKAVVYTHFHPDHINGVQAYASAEDVRSGKVEIIAHETLLGNVTRQGALVGPILGVRSGYSFGLLLPAADRAKMNAGIGPIPSLGRNTFLPPTRTFSDSLDVTIAGVRMQLVHVPSEAPDEIAIYLPEKKVLLSAETIQGPTLPNVHTLRGTKFRDPVPWVRSIDVLRSFEAEHMVPSHGQPVSGVERVEEVLRMTRDGIQFIHDQTVRHMNKGLTPGELVEVVRFPPHLAGYAPYLREYYGTVAHAVRQIYQGYLGWFEGDPVALAPTPRTDAARRTVALMGGRDRVLQEARRALEDGDPQWAAEVATHLVRIDRGDMDARGVKADAFRRLGYAQININWRNWYLMSALELEGRLDAGLLQGAMAAAFASPDLIAALPARRFVEGLTVRLAAEKTLGVHRALAIRFTDLGETYGLEVRRGVAQFHDGPPPDPDLGVALAKSALDRVLLGQATLGGLLEAGEAVIEHGEPGDVQRFFGWFESPLGTPIELTLR